MEGLPNSRFHAMMKCQGCLRTSVRDVLGQNTCPGHPRVWLRKNDVDAWHKAGHDGGKVGEKETTMTLIINNHDVEELLTMEMTLEALEESYLALARQEAVCRPRIDIRIPTSDPSKNYQWGTMEGGSTGGYF